MNPLFEYKNMAIYYWTSGFSLERPKVMQERSLELLDQPVWKWILNKSVDSGVAKHLNKVKGTRESLQRSSRGLE